MARKNDYIQGLDKIIGGRIRELRLNNGLSREELAGKAGVTHQQMQKYEKGTNRISVGRLVLIAKALKKPVEYFYEGIDAAFSQPEISGSQRMCLEVSRNFMKITCPDHQIAINNLIKAISKTAAA